MTATSATQNLRNGYRVIEPVEARLLDHRPLVHRVDRPRVVTMLSTYPPTRCGLATFAAATRNGIGVVRPGWHVPVVRVVAGTDASSGAATQSERRRSSSNPIAQTVAATWLEGNTASLDTAVSAVRRSDCLVVQHEFGIFGGADGCEIAALLERVDVPVIVILHTVPSRPTIGQRLVIANLERAASRLVVMSHAARERLLRSYPISPDRVVVIGHGAHAVPFRVPLATNRAPVLLTWGLVGPGKGLERAIDAVAQLVAAGIDVTYRIVGETHPKVRQIEGETYRDSLKKRASQRGVADRITFESSHVPTADLTPIIHDADVVLIPYDSRDQVTSGVLTEAVAAGKVVIATAFPHAVELLANGAGLVVDHDDPTAMSKHIARVIMDPALALLTSRLAEQRGKDLLWPSVCESLATLVSSVLRASGHNARPRPNDHANRTFPAFTSVGSPPIKTSVSARSSS